MIVWPSKCDPVREDDYEPQPPALHQTSSVRWRKDSSRFKERKALKKSHGQKSEVSASIYFLGRE